jgi:hypothetical protein
LLGVPYLVGYALERVAPIGAARIVLLGALVALVLCFVLRQPYWLILVASPAVGVLVSSYISSRSH